MTVPVPIQPPIRRGSMPVQPWAGHPLLRLLRRLLGRTTPRPWRSPDDRRPVMARRLTLLALVLAGALVGTQYMADILPNHGAGWLEQGILLLFGVLFAWISAGFWTGVMGAWVMLRGRDGQAVTRVLEDPAVARGPLAPGARTAIIMPICNEHVATVFGGLRATYESLQRSGLGRHFDFFVLSDTNQPDLRAAEQAAWSELSESLRGAPGFDASASSGIHYRWRQYRTKRKAGNVADFCRRWGRNYRYMVVLDADSVMTGDCLTSLVRLMEAHPDAGIIQTAPRACGHDTLHARILQFGSRVYGPVYTAGMHYWQLGESHYWGHNAILRMAPFMQHCALAPIRGNGSLSGDIMSHDFVEAALMRRAGWKVWIAYDLPGSYEQFPPNLIAEVQRDRRWCQGNLQNSRLMFEPGLHAVHRTVFLTGVLAYLSAPLWLGFLLLSTLLFADEAGKVPQYFVEPYQLFPIWPTANLQLMLTLFGLTAVLLLAPKALAVLLVIAKGQAQHYGGALRLAGGAIVEFIHSTLLAPVRMLFHAQFVLAAITGWRTDWKSPPREDDATPWGEALRRHGPQTLFAALWVAAILHTGAPFPWWLSPIIGGLLLAVPLSVWTSRRSAGQALRRAGLLTIPEERHEPAVLVEARRHAMASAGVASAGFVAAVIDRESHRRVCAASPCLDEVPPAKTARLAGWVERAMAEGPMALTPGQRLRLLGHAPALRQLRDAVVRGDAHPDWWTQAPLGGQGAPARDSGPVPATGTVPVQAR